MFEVFLLPSRYYQDTIVRANNIYYSTKVLTVDCFLQSNIPAILGTETVVNKKPEADTIPVNATILSGSTILVFVVALVLVYAGSIESTAKVSFG